MEDQEKPKKEKKKKSLLSRLLRIFGWMVLSVVGLVILVLILIQLPFVQNFARKKVVSYLENKLHTQVAIGKLDIDFPTALSLKQVYFEDQSKDTLLYGDEIKVDISMLRLLRNEINIQGIYLDGIVANLHRQPPDSIFNFQFIIDAFAGEQKKQPEKEDTSTMKMSVDEIVIDNSHFIYKDLYTGNDLNIKLHHFKTEIKTFDPAHMLFNIDLIDVKGLTGHFYQLEPMHKPIEDVVKETAAQPENVMQLISNTIRLSDINFQFNSDASHLKSAYIIGRAELHPGKIDLKNMVIALKDASLENADIAIATNPALANEPPIDTITIATAPSLKIIADELVLKNSSFKMDDLSKPPAPSGIDFSHLFLTEINIESKNLLYSSDTMRAQLLHAHLKDHSGFALNEMQVDFEMNPTGVSLNDLYIRTPQSEIRRFATISYPSLEALSKDPGVLGLNIDLDESTIALKDVLFFVPQLEAQLTSLKNESLFADARITGTVSNVQFQKLLLKGLSGTNINLHGTIAGLPDPNNIYANLNIETLATNKKDVTALLPQGTLPSNIQLPSGINASGIVRGGMDNLFTSLGIRTDMGNVHANGTLANITDQQHARYNMSIAAKGLQLGKILANPELGIFTGNAKFTGKGLDPKTADATFEINIPKAGYHQYTYNNIAASGSIKNGKLNTDLQIKDPNVATTLSLQGSFSGKYPAVALQGVIDSINVMALNYSASPLKYHGRIYADFQNTDPDALNGKLAITHSIVATDKQSFKIDSMTVVARANGDTNSIVVHTGFASLNLAGNYKLTQLGNIFVNAINPYFKISEGAIAQKTDPYHFTLTGTVYDNPALRAVLPDLESLKTIQLHSTFDSDSGWNLSLKSPHINYKSMVIDSVNLIAGTRDSVLALHLGMDRFINGTSISIYKTSVDGTLSNNKLSMGIGIEDKEGKQKYFLRGNVFEDPAGAYVFSLRPDSLRLNYDQWHINPQNQIIFGENGIVAQNFVLNQGSQMLSINSQSPAPSAPLQLEFSNFQISTLTGFVQTDSLLVNGLLNGNATIKNLQTQPTFIANISINDLSIYKDTLGVLTARVNNEIANRYNAAITLQGYGNDIAINGDYFVKPKNSSFDFTIAINKFAMQSLEGLSNGAIRNGQGFVYGNIRVDGNLENRNIDGHLQFDHTSFVPAKLNNVFKIDKEAIAIINNEGVRFNSFTIRDTANNTLTLGGMVHTKDWANFRFDMTVRADNFQAINSTKKDNDLFYGKLIFSTRLTIEGTPEKPIIDGKLTINENTVFTVVLPQEDPGIAKREGIVRFVDYSATAEDSLFMAPYDSLKEAPLKGYDVAVNISIDKKAEFNLIVDAANGDFLHMRGTGELSGGIDPSGKINLTGSYEIEEGSYSLSFNFLKRKFLIQKGSRIVWTGDPTSAQVDVTAIYVANTAPYELVQGMLSGDLVYYKQKLPFEVHLNMDGELLKPVITFDIVLPEKNYTVSNAVINTVDQRLIQLRQEPSELNKQVFALLLLNRFIGENPFNNSSGGGMDVSTFAMQSASRLLTEQLNSLTEGLIQGVDLNFDLATTEDYTTGEKRDRTNFKVGITKRLLNDRLTVTVGNNFELEGPRQTNERHSGIADNISINYALSKDGRYMLRAYRTNDYTGAIEGYVIETGLSFIITLDYNKLSEIFRSKKEREKKKEVRKQNKKMKNENKNLQEEQKNVTPPAMQQENESQQ